jgi:hypothetical protein
LNYIYSHIKHYLFPKLGKARKPELYINEILNLHNSLIEYYTYTKQLTKIKKTKEFKYIKKIVNGLNSDSGFLSEIQEKAKENEKKRKENEKKRIEQDLKKFINYEISWFKSEFNYLRVTKDGENIETNEGAKVTMQEARILYKMIKAGKDIKGHKIGYYTVISINGSLKIGCHNIERNEINRIANLLNW